MYLPTIDYPCVVQRFLGAHGARTTGVSLAHAADWLAVRSRFILSALEAFPQGARSVIVQSELMKQQNALPRLPRGASAAATYLGPTADPARARRQRQLPC